MTQNSACYLRYEKNPCGEVHCFVAMGKKWGLIVFVLNYPYKWIFANPNQPFIFLRSVPDLLSGYLLLWRCDLQL